MDNPMPLNQYVISIRWLLAITVLFVATKAEAQLTGASAITTHRPARIRAPLEQKPNIILVMADDQGWGDCSYTGHETLQTPNLDAMAATGIVFNRFYAGAPVCSPTRASVLTGRNPVRTNVPNHGHYLRPHEITLAEALKDTGYVTGHFGKWHIGSVQPDSPTSPGGQGFDEWLSGLNFFDSDPYLSRSGEYLQAEGQGSVITMDATLEFLRKHKDDGRPMFAVTWFPAPHLPHKELPADTVLFNGEMDAYYHEIQLVDQQLGRLRAELREMQIADNTIVWYCSDNGGLNPETSGGREKKGSVYEGGLRVPSIVEWPLAFEPAQIDIPAVTSDIYPTLLNIAGASIENQPRLDGIDLAGIIAGNQTSRPAIGFWHHFRGGEGTKSDELIRQLMEAKQSGLPNPFPERILKNANEFPDVPNRLKGHAAWNQWPWKLHRIEDRKGEITFELYHLENDPLEQRNLATDEPRRLEQMKAELAQWQASVLQSLQGADYPGENDSSEKDSGVDGTSREASGRGVSDTGGK